MSQPVLMVSAGEGRALDAAGLIRCRVSSHDTNGLYTILELTLPPGGGPSFHVHQREDEVFYIIEGELTVGSEAGDQLAQAGDTVVFPSGTKHSFRNESRRPTRVLITAIPGGLDQYFEEIAAAAGSGQENRLLEINQKYEIDFNPPVE